MGRLGGLHLVAFLVLVEGCASPGFGGLPTTWDSNWEETQRILLAPEADQSGDRESNNTREPNQSKQNDKLSDDLDSRVLSLNEVIAYSISHNPRLDSARAMVEKASGLEQVAFAPFLPQVDLQSQTGVTSPNLGPGVPGIAGFMIPEGLGVHTYGQVEAQLQWTIYDFGRTVSRHRQAVAREGVARFRLARAEQTIEFDATVAYLNLLLAKATRKVAEEGVRRAEFLLHDSRARKKAGTVDAEAVLRSEVFLSEVREVLVDAMQGERESIAKLNFAMGRNPSLAVEIQDISSQPRDLFPLAHNLECAVQLRPEIGVTREMVSAAVAGREAVKAEFQPRIYTRATAGHAGGGNIRTGWQEGAGLHLDIPLFSGGKLRGELRQANAELIGAVADAQSILDGISLEVNLAYRSVIAAREKIELTRVAIDQARENLRNTRTKFSNGDATPTEIVDAETLLNRTQQRYSKAEYVYLASLARLNYTTGKGQLQSSELEESQNSQGEEKELPAPLLSLPKPAKD